LRARENADQLLYRASKPNCDACSFKTRCCPKEPARKILRSIYEEARDVARAIAKTEAFERSRRERKRVEMLFAHLKRILRPADCDCADRAAPNSSSRSPPSPRICAVSPN
jgi:hypothetical protein